MGQRNFELELQQQFGLGTKIHVDDAADRVMIELPDGNRHYMSTDQARQLPFKNRPVPSLWANSVPNPSPPQYFDPEYYGTGTVLGWVMHGRFSYIAIKVKDRRRQQFLWYTSATDENTQVGQTLTDSEMATLINTHPQVSDVGVAERWKAIK